jgi:putative oxidoreductase
LAAEYHRNRLPIGTYALREVVMFKRLDKISWLGPLLVRITVGVVFLMSGLGKLKGLDGVANFFAELHIPWPHFNAVLASTTEFLGGICILVGLGTRLAAPPLAFTMFVAIITAKRENIEGVTSLLGFEETTYLVVFLWLTFAGAGKASLDHLLSRRLGRRAPPLRPGIPPDCCSDV